MKLMNRFYSLLALLLVGSASLQAQSDPFPDISTVAYKYQGTMTCTSQVVMNGEIVTDAVVAAYCGDDFRGKNSTGKDPGHPNHVCLTIYGDHTITKQNIHFKVYMQGKIFTYNPDPAFVYTFNGTVGSTANPYIIDITPVSLANDADNTTTLTTYKDETCDVALTGRTLYKDGNWNTLCLPFTLTASEVNEHLKNPTGLMTLSSSSFDSTTGTLTLNFSNELENGIVAGKPYIVKWNKPDGYTLDGGFDITDPVFTGVTISDATANVSTDYVSDANTLYYPTAEGYKVNSCRAWFQLKNGLTCGTPAAHVSAFNLNFDGEETSIHNAQFKIHNEAGAWYSLDGRQIVNRKSSNRKMQKGLYINNGKKVVIN